MVMDSATPPLLTFVLTAGAICALLVWGLDDGRLILRGDDNPQPRRTALVAVALGLGTCLILTPLLHWGLLSPLAGGPMSAGALFAYCWLENRRRGWWQHRRLRPFAIAALTALSLALATWAPWPELVPLAAAMAIFHLHLKAREAVAAEYHAQVLSLKDKLLDLELEARHSSLLAGQAATPRPNIKQAG